MEEIPDPALIVLIGPSGSGKSTWAASRFRNEEIVSSDRLRGLVGSGEHDLDASAVAFGILDQIVEARVGRRLATVVDTLGFDADRRHAHRAAADKAGLPAVAVVFEVAESVCRARNRSRPRPVPAAVLTGQFRRMRHVPTELASEGWDLIVRVQEQQTEAPIAPEIFVPTTSIRPGLEFYLQISRFPAAEQIRHWLAEMAAAAETAGFLGLAVMDHLVQIPQVGREWDNIVEAYSALAFVAATTTTLQLGTLVTGASLRNPALLAKTLASLDVLSGGRAFCGLGAGWFDAEQVAYGYPRLGPGKRIDILEDTINVLRLMWGPGKASYSGKVHTVNEAVCYPRPLHPIPIFVGGKGRRTIDLACRLADGLNIIGSERLDDALPAVKDKLEERPDFRLSILDLPLLGEDRAAVAEAVEQWRGRSQAETFAARHHAGIAARHAKRYRQLAERGVRAIFVSPVGLTDPGEISQWASLIELANEIRGEAIL